ncbi:MAG: MFS transporter [Alphaproteobacteria bacterium]|nr:MFS transporter [Alphaproteobacteria bacterium]
MARYKTKNSHSLHPIRNKKHSNDPSKINKKILLSAIIGNGLEFYDFALFGAFSVTFSQLFFTGDKISSLLSTLSLFALAFFVRPLGSIFFGYLGDVFGRKKALSYSIIFMGLFTFLIGCLPVYKDVGYLAPVLLLCCRLGQGFCLGGENNGSAIFLLEHMKKRKGFAGALILTGGAAGTILATFFSALSNLSFMPEWSWRVPFLFGILIGLLGTYIRRSIDETPEFLMAQAPKERSAPLPFVLKNYTKPFLCAMGIGGVNGVLAYTLVVYISVYLTTIVKYPLTNSLLYSCIGLIIFGSLSPLMGHIADKVGERKVMLTSCLITIFCSPFIFYLLHQQTAPSIFMAILISALTMSTFNAPTNALLQRLFPTRVRYTGIALGYAVGIALLGGTQPLICTYLIETTQNPFSPAFYLIFAASVGMIALFFSRKAEVGSAGFSQIIPEYSLPSKLKSGGIPSLEKNAASMT